MGFSVRSARRPLAEIGRRNTRSLLTIYLVFLAYHGEANHCDVSECQRLSQGKERLKMDCLLTRTTLLTRREVAEILRLKETTIKAKTARGEIPSVKMGRAVRYRPQDIHRYVVEHTREISGTSSPGPGLDKRP